METNLRKTQSLRCVATDHALSWTEAGLRDKKKSVWQLVAQYQNAVAGKTKAADSAENKQKTLQFAAIPITVIKTKEKSNAWADRSTSTQLTRSKSMEYLPRQRTISTSALRELFESKVAMKPKSVNKPKNTDKPQSTSGKENVGLNHNNTEDLLVLIEADSINNNDEDGEKSAKPTKEKENNVTSKMAKAPRVERRKTFTGVNSERIVTQSGLYTSHTHLRDFPVNT